MSSAPSLQKYNVVPGEKPPLVPGLYVEVEIYAPVREDLVVIPRSSIHDDAVYLVGDGDRLVRRPVGVAFVQEELAVVSEGLVGGETLILTDLVPAVEGSLLAPQVDELAREALIRDAGDPVSDR